MTEPLQFDLVRIGGVFAGLVAAWGRIGLRTTVLEAGDDDGYRVARRRRHSVSHKDMICGLAMGER
jgi:monoamine oxidase